MTTKTREKKFQEDVRESAHRIWLAGLGALSMAGESGNRLFQQLVETGKSFEARGKEGFERTKDEVEGKAKKTRERVEARFDEMWERMDEKLGEAMHRFGVPTRDEIEALTHRVEELNKKVDRLHGGNGGKPERNVYHVVTHEEGWKVESEGTTQPISVHGTKGEAVSAARELAQGHVPSQVVVHKKDGKFQTEYSYDAN